MGATRKSEPRFTEAEYFAYESTSPERHEFYRGEVFAMAGNSFAHVRLSTNLLVALAQRLRGSRCEPFDQSLRIKIGADGLITYPDASVFCGPVDRVVHSQGEAATNPTGLFEILSDSTEAYDRGSKFDLYRELPSLRFYVLISQKEVLVEVFTWSDDRIHRQEFRGLNAVATFGELRLSLPMTELYERVEFSDGPKFRVMEEGATDYATTSAQPSY